MSDPRPPRPPRQRGEPPGDRPKYTVYRSRPRALSFLDRRTSPSRDGGLRNLRAEARAADARTARSRITPKRVVLAVLAAVAGWLLLSLVMFLVSAQFEQEQVSDAAQRTLDGAGPMPFSANTILVLGSDARPKGSKEGGANPGGPSRSDTIMLIRTGGGAAARLSIPRDTVVDIPGHGPDKINAAYAIGGAALTVTTIKRFLGIEINHLVEVNFTKFPEFIDALGGVDVTTGCVVSNINGGKKNGGTTLILKPGTHTLNGTQALALARTRTNECNPAEDDLTRAKRQQQILSGVKSALLTPRTFFHLPWVAWTAPQTIRSDMGGPTLMGLMASQVIGGTPQPRVLKPTGFVTLPDGGAGLTVSDDVKKQEVQRFLDG